MQIELEAGALRIGHNQTLKVIDAAGTTVCVLDGEVWITEEKEANDVVLQPGMCYRLRHKGVALVNVLSGTASVRLA